MTISTLLWILGIGVLLYFMRRSGGGCCGGGHDHEDKKGDSDHAGHGSSHLINEGNDQHSSRTEISKYDSEKDPVCSMDLGDHLIGRNHLGRTFYFCSEKCRKIFDLNPNKYVET